MFATQLSLLKPSHPLPIKSRVDKTTEFLPWLVCDQGDKILGYAYADRYRTRAAYQWLASVSVYVDSSVHRKGVGRALYTSLFAILKLQGLHNLYAVITQPDVGGSVGFHRSFGFRQIGHEESVGYKLDAWYHVSTWHLLLRPLVPNPQAPIAVADVQRTASWAAAVSAGLPFVSGKD